MEEEELRENRMFPIELFPRLMGKAIQALKLPSHEAGPSTEVKQPEETSKFMPPEISSITITVPVPASFKQIIKAEWKEPAKPRWAPKSISKLYAMPDEAMAFLKVLAVDQPVAALSSLAIIPSEGEGVPKDPCDRRVEAVERVRDLSSGIEGRHSKLHHGPGYGILV